MLERQQRFVTEYLIDLNATQAAIRAGWPPHLAKRKAYKLLKEPKILEAVTKVQQAQLDKANIAAIRVLEEMRRVAFSNPRRLFDESGNLKPIHTLTDEEAACIASFDVVQRNLTSGDGQVETVIKIKCWDKPRTLEMLGKHFGLLQERIEHGGTITLKHELDDKPVVIASRALPSAE